MSATIIFETDGEVIALRPDEIADEDIISQAVNCKTALTVRIYPTFEAWQKCKRTLTYVKMLDLDKTSDRIAFIGRVSAVADSMDSAGRLVQEITCVSAADYLEDTAHIGAISGKNLSVYMADELSEHNDAVDLSRRLTYTITGNASVNSEGMDITGTRYNALSEILTGGKYLSKLVSPSGAVPYYTMEWKERYANDVAYIDIAERFGETKDTAIIIGENLKDIKVERNTDGGIYTSVLAVGGVNSDGSRATHSAANSAMQTLYGTGRVLIVDANDIRCTAPMWDYIYAGGAEAISRSNAQLAMLDALRVYADQEAAKLSDPPMKITINAVDLARLGLAGYDGFEVGNSHPVVCPPLGLFGEPMRITAVKRKLASGQIASLTIEKGQKAGAKSSGTLSYFMARLEEENRVGTEEQRQTEIAQTKAEEQTDGYVIKGIEEQDFDDLPSTSPLKTRGLCVIRDSQTGKYKLALNGDYISSEGGGGEIQYAAILSEEQMSEWAPDHELTPLWFRGTATVYYGQAPSRFVVQNNRVLWGSTAAVEDDIAEIVRLEMFDGTVLTCRAFISSFRYQSGLHALIINVAVYDGNGVWLGNLGGYNVGITPPYNTLKIGIAVRVSAWSTRAADNKLYPTITLKRCIAVDGVVSEASTGVVPTSGMGFSNPVPCTDAERDFALALTTRTEPVS